jgi:DNA-binding transcriptional MerR regulator
MTVSLEDTRVYRDIVRETKLKIIQRLLSQGLGLEAIADAVEMPISEVQAAIQQLQRQAEG